MSTQDKLAQEVRAAMRYRMALGSWYARMFAAGRAGRPFDEPRPQIKDYLGDRQ